MIELRPFTPLPHLPISASASLELLEREGARAKLTFRLHGPWPWLYPQFAQNRKGGQFKDELWRASCFECFIGATGEQSYLELNVSPEGDWAMYLFDQYRQGMRPYKEARAPEWQMRLQNSDIIAQIIFVIPPAWRNKSLLWRPAFIASFHPDPAKAENSYWSHQHPAERADFHRMDYAQPL